MKWPRRDIHIRGFVRGLGCLCCLVATAALALDPQKAITQFHHERWGPTEGLDRINAVTQTGDGYIWVVSQTGLLRFDGAQFTRWNPKPGESRIPGYIQTILAASDASLWVSSAADLTRLSAGHSTNYNRDQGMVSGHVMALCEDSQGTIWAGGYNGLCKFSGDKWRSIDADQKPPQGSIRAMAIDRDETMWVSVATTNGPSSGFIAWRRKGQKRFEASSEQIPRCENLAVAQGNKMWAAEPSGGIVRAFSGAEGNFRFTAPEIKLASQCVQIDRDGTLWIGTLGSGLARVRDPASLGPETIEAKSDAVQWFTEENGLCNDHVNCLFEDREGNIWVGGLSGLDCFSETKITSYSIREGLPYNESLMLSAAQDGSLWVASRNRGLFRMIPASPATANAPLARALAKSIVGINCVYGDQTGGLLAATPSGVFKVDNESLVFKGSTDSGKTLAMTRDLAGALWLCDERGGLVRVVDDVATPIDRGEPLGPYDFACAALTDKLGRVWLGYTSGIVDCWSNGTFRHYSKQDGLNLAQIRGIFNDTKGRLWVVAQYGVAVFHGSRFEGLLNGRGLPDDECYAMLQDDAGFLWLAQMSQVLRIDPDALERAILTRDSQGRASISFDSFGFSDGLKGYIRQPFGQPGRGYPLAAKTVDGRLWFSTSAGLAVIDPHHVAKNLVPPPVRIEQVITSGKTNRSFENPQFSGGIKDLEFDYSGLSYANPSKVLFKYKLEGHDRAWVDAGTRRQAFYSNLRPKSYKFQVRARNNDGVWSESDATVSFAIVPAFYQTYWFPIACALPVVFVAWGLHRLRLARQAVRMSVLLETQLKERKRIAQELHDTLLQGFTGIGLKLDALANTLPPALGATKEQLQRILERSDEYLVEARRAVWELRSPSLETVAEFSEALKKVCERALQGTAIELRFGTNGVACKLAPAVEDNLVRVCEEAVTNAVKHAGPTQVTVKLEYGSDELRLHIRDNGCGFEPPGPGGAKAGHFGLVGIHERVKSLGGDVSVKSRHGEGTEILVAVPMSS